jgi:superfamily II DNA or RNA helicase
VLEKRGPALQTLDDGRLLARDFSAEAAAADLLRATGLQPVDGDALQWRSPDAADAAAFDTARVWSLLQESQFSDFWAEQVPLLQAQGWSIVVGPGFAHESVPVQAWRIRIDPATGETQGKELAEPVGERTSAVDSSGLALPARKGSWLMTLGVDIDGESLDLAPMLADLLRRDARWLNATQLHEIDDAARVILRAPGGKRVEAPGAVLKAIIGRMLDLLAPGQNPQGPLQLSEWDLPRLESLHQDLQQIAATHLAAHGMAGTQIAWHAEGAAGLPALVTRLQREAPVEEIAPPPGLGLTLRPYQLQGVAWLQYLRRHALGGILADEMGLGKTAQTLAHLLIEKQAGRLDLPALIVLPASLLFNWVAEAARIAPALRVLVLHGPRRAADFARIAEHDLVLTTYTLVRRDLARLATQPWHLLVLDEAQLVKNPASRGARALRRLRARHRLCLTGTPLENHLGELWAQFDFLMPGFLGSARQFWQVWRKPIEVIGESVRAEILAQRVRPFMLRRRKQDVATDLPPRVDIVRRVRLEGTQRELYESVRVAADTQVRRVLAKSGLPGAQIQVLDALLRLRQVCCDPALVPGNTGVPPHRAKLELLNDLLPSLVAEGRRVLVFSQFVEMLTLVSGLLDTLGLPHLTLTGDTPPVDRAALVRRFQASDAPDAQNVPLMLVSLKAGGLGLNLTAADAVVLIDPWWNPAVEEQAAARAHRIGQQRTVFVYRVLVEGSIEERMLELQARKSLLAEGILGHDLGGALKFSAEELQGLLAPLR